MKHIPYYLLDDDEEEPRYVSGIENMTAATLRGMVMNLINGYPMYEHVEIELKRPDIHLLPSATGQLSETEDERNHEKRNR